MGEKVGGREEKREVVNVPRAIPAETMCTVCYSDFIEAIPNYVPPIWIRLKVDTQNVVMYRINM